MKKSVLYLLLAPLLFFSCKRNQQQPGPVAKTYKVNFNVSGFNQTILNSIKSKKTDALQTDSVISDTSSNDSLNVLDYMVYTSKGLPVHALITQQSTNGKFTSISDNLPAGTYTIVFIAGKTGLTYVPGGNGRIALDGFEYHSPTEVFKDLTDFIWHDTFYKQFSLTVSGSDTTVNTALPRLVSQLEVNIEDALPANTSYFRLSFSNVLYYYALTGTNSVGSAVTCRSSVPASAIGTTNFQIYNIMVPIPGGTPTNVEIQAYDTSDNLIGDAVVNNVTFQANMKTLLTGKLFGTSSTNSFNITLNQQWNPVPYKTINY